jgi:hypothetical protein
MKTILIIVFSLILGIIPINGAHSESESKIIYTDVNYETFQYIDKNNTAFKKEANRLLEINGITNKYDKQIGRYILVMWLRNIISVILSGPVEEHKEQISPFVSSFMLSKNCKELDEKLTVLLKNSPDIHELLDQQGFLVDSVFIKILFIQAQELISQISPMLVYLISVKIKNYYAG